MNFHGPYSPRHVQQVLAACQEPRVEFDERYVQFIASAKKTDLLRKPSRRNGPVSNTTAQRMARIIATFGHSIPACFDVRRDRLFFTSCETYPPGRVAAIQLFDNLIFLATYESDLL
ncbi:hypothetical protein ONS95_012329 [Cadophora gregata]|uniref:uncharacterized protein n=1 Tax=Cadophora gregata TaxID=51156 RepID=UPI0026DA7C43|nr:uncharacterized protein ONS95_012329 [Cadophora gregata]KAK0118018.1 hypothetical protein ONS95_012329 [Cadophora gregata]KAK0123084.1 hypothetical protein ONS96_010092 [Cadophora gregata f. sp. sojae]